MSHSIREMTTEDLSGCVVSWSNIPGIGLFPDSDNVPSLSKYLQRNPNHSCVSCEGNQIIGTVLCGHDGRMGHLYHLAVHPHHRRNGLGEKLVSSSLASLSRDGITKCNIFLFKSNELGKEFWLSTGGNQRDDLTILQKFT